MNFKTNKIMKAIGVKMVDLQPMCAGEAQYKGYITNNYEGNDNGYEVTYPNGFKTWFAKEQIDKEFFILNKNNDGSIILKEDVENFITKHTTQTIGIKTTLVQAITITGFELIDYSACVSPKNYSQELGEKYAMENITNKLWSFLGFVLQWAKNGLNIKTENNTIPPYIQRMIEEYKELNIKCFKLKTFIDSSDIFKNLSTIEQTDMQDQYNSMRDYLVVLGRRINRTGIDISDTLE